MIRLNKIIKYLKWLREEQIKASIYSGSSECLW
jgi:hypothetical protein